MNIYQYPKTDHLYLHAKNCGVTIEINQKSPVKMAKGIKQYDRYTMKVFPIGLAGTDVPEFELYQDQFKTLKEAIAFAEKWLKDNNLYLGSFWQQITAVSMIEKIRATVRSEFQKPPRSVPARSAHSHVYNINYSLIGKQVLAGTFFNKE